MEETPKGNRGDRSDSKLRRWVSNLQLESWQLELLITGFSIFLLASSLDEYERFRSAMVFDRLSPGSSSSNPLFALSGIFLLNTIPWALRFFLINLLIHLLLRGFWIGIVGLSSVSSVIDFDGLKLRGKFRKFIPSKVRSLDELIVYLDKISSVIFAYTYLLVFSILSVMIVFMIMIAILGLIVWFSAMALHSPIFGILNVVLTLATVLFIVSALLFFIDSLFFSTFKKSGWFSAIYYYIYRFFSVISLSFIYRSIYYHLITNFKKKEIISVSLVLILCFVAWKSFSGWSPHKFYPEAEGDSPNIVETRFYDDTRGDQYIKRMSIPSKYVKNGYLEIFIHYDPAYNMVMQYKCPEGANLRQEFSIADGFRAGVEASRDTSKTVDELLAKDVGFEERVIQATQCLAQIFNISIDGESMKGLPFSFYTHPAKGEKGFLVLVDVSGLKRGRHELDVEFLKFRGIPFMQEVTEDKLEFETMARLPFWTL